jgi:hypothetical protein
MHDRGTLRTSHEQLLVDDERYGPANMYLPWNVADRDVLK